MGRVKVERFRTFMPVLESICNPGMKDRHWELVSIYLGITLCPASLTDIDNRYLIKMYKILFYYEDNFIAPILFKLLGVCFVITVHFLQFILK